VSEYNRLSAVGFGADGLGLLARDNQDALDPQICTVRPTFLYRLAGAVAERTPPACAAQKGLGARRRVSRD
jgi:hypothetical protein